MQRPDLELFHSDLPTGIKATRRLLAYLLRATRLRMNPERPAPPPVVAQLLDHALHRHPDSRNPADPRVRRDGYALG